MRDLITGDAVVLDLPVARLASRGVAFAIDVFVLGVVFFVIALVESLSGVFGTDDALAAATVLSTVVLVFVGIPVTVETLTRGRSLGKLAMGLRVVRDDGGPIRFRQALARGLAGFVVDFGVFSLFTGAVALFTSLLSAQGRRVGDMLAGTVVVRERVAVPRQAPIGMPPQLMGWAQSLTLSQLPDVLALEARQFLQRAAQLEPQVRATLAVSFATDVVARISPPPPPGAPPELVLAAVLAERSRREGQRLAQQAHAVRAADAAASGPPAPPWAGGQPASPTPWTGSPEASGGPPSSGAGAPGGQPSPWADPATAPPSWRAEAGASATSPWAGPAPGPATPSPGTNPATEASPWARPRPDAAEPPDGFALPR